MTNVFSGKAYALAYSQKGEEIILPLFDELVIKKTERKKIQIIISGAYKKGVRNNEKSFLYSLARNFFDTEGFSFGIEIFLTKNIPENSGFSEEQEQKKIVIAALREFSGKNIQNKSEEENYEKFLERIPDPHIFLHLFPRYSLPQNFLDQSIHYRNISAEDCILECFYEVQKKFLECSLQKKKGEISDFGLIGNSGSIWVKKL